jgi:sugar transferase (PEP-CTERM system associated)
MVRLFRHYIPKSLIFLALVELAILPASIYLGAWLRFRGEDVPLAVEGLAPLWPKALLFTAVMTAAMVSMGLYQRHAQEGFGGMLLRTCIAFALGLLVMSLLFYTFPTLFLGRGAFGYAFGFALLAVLLTRKVFLGLADQEYLKRRVLVLGTGERARQIADLKETCEHCGFTVAGYIHMQGEEDRVEVESIVPLNTSLLELVNRYRVDEVVVAVQDRRRALPVHEILDCKMSGVIAMDVLTFFERETGKVKLDALHPSWLIFSDGFRQGPLQDYGKRGFDVLAASLLLLVTWPVMLLTALSIYVESGFSGPILYRQVRVGRNWKLFQVLKFRSMRVDAEKDGVPRWASQNDSRVTTVGAFIRKVRIDELPQIFNVLRGDMSFVGPRPERPMFVEQLSERIHYYSERHRVKPGITGWAQICYPYGATERDAVEKLEYDLYYVKNYGLFLDLLILMQTVQVILWGKGAR